MCGCCAGVSDGLEMGGAGTADRDPVVFINVEAGLTMVQFPTRPMPSFPVTRCEI